MTFKMPDYSPEELRQIARMWDESAGYCDKMHEEDLAERDRRIAGGMRHAADILEGQSPIAFRNIFSPEVSDTQRFGSWQSRAIMVVGLALIIIFTILIVKF